jgi:hypothetical protein
VHSRPFDALSTIGSHVGIEQPCERACRIMTPKAEKETPPGAIPYAANMLRRDPMFMYAVQSGANELGPATVRGQYGPAMYM